MSTQQTPDRAAERTAELNRLSGESTALVQNNAQLPTPSRSAPDFSMGNQGVMIRTLDDAWTFSNIVYNSGLAPKSLSSPAQVLIALQMGLEVGLPPMAAIQNTAVINGRPSLWGPIMLALCRSSGWFDEAAFDESFDYNAEGIATKCTCTVRRLPNGKPIVREFSYAEAQTAGLAGKDTWQKYRKRMLQFRARGLALNDAFPDVLRGVLSQEEAADLPAEKNITPTTPAERPQTLTDLAQQLSDETAPAQVDREIVTERADLSAALAAAENKAAENKDNPAPPPPTTTPQLTLVQEIGGSEQMTIDEIKERLQKAPYVSDVRVLLKLWIKAERSEFEKNTINELCNQRISEIKSAGTAQKG